MEYFFGTILIALVLFWVFCLILRFMLGTDKLIDEAQRQTALLEDISAQLDGAPKPEGQERDG